MFTSPQRLTDKEVKLVNKWKILVDDLPCDRDRAVCAKQLESQERYFSGQVLSEEELKEARQLMEDPAGGTISVPSDPTLTGVARLKKVVIPMIRRIFPYMITNEVVGVQPMEGPVGLAYALRFIYQTTAGGITAGQEAGYNNISSTWNGPYTTANGEGLAGTGLIGGSTGDMVEMGLRVESQTITAKSRKIKARWTLEAEQDLQAMHGVKIKDEATDILSYEVSAGVDQEILYYIKQNALAGGVYNWTYTTSGGPGADGRWEQEIFRTFYTKLLAASNDIARATRRGPGNFVIASTNVCAMLESLNALIVSPVKDTSINLDQIGTAKVGKIGRINIS